MPKLPLYRVKTGEPTLRLCLPEEGHAAPCPHRLCYNLKVVSVKRGLSGILAVVLLACLGAAGEGQAPPKPSQSTGTDTEKFRVRVERVPVLFTAVDRKDRFITDLAKGDVEVFDNRKKQEILDFSRETDLPLRVGLVIDTSNSIRERFKFEKEAAIEFLRSILRPKTDLAFLMSFDTNVEVVQDFTDDIEKLTKGINTLQAGGGTAMYDAIYMAARDKLMTQAPEGGLRRTIILISDGEDNQSRASREETLAMAQRTEVTIFTISTNITGVQQRGDQILKRFSEETGGRAFFPFKLQDMTSSFENISRELRSQYSLIFRPSTPRDGTFHVIQVTSLRKGVKVRARKGYFATPE